MNLRQAVKTAIGFFGESFESEHPVNVQLEEVEMSDDGLDWLITVGYDVATSLEGTMLGQTFPGLRVRKYKVVKVNARTGQPGSIKIRPEL
jgi:hypothetical protein